MAGSRIRNEMTTSRVILQTSIVCDTAGGPFPESITLASIYQSLSVLIAGETDEQRISLVF